MRLFISSLIGLLSSVHVGAEPLRFVWVCSLWGASNPMVVAATGSACLEPTLPSSV